MESKKSNRSLFLYTGLIFIAAIVVIALSFFAQINSNNTHKKILGEENSATTITEKISHLSEENKTLWETTQKLNKSIDELTAENTELTEKVLTLDKQMSNAHKMYGVYDKLRNGSYEEARLELDTVETLFLTEEQDVFYQYLVEEVNALAPPQQENKEENS